MKAEELEDLEIYSKVFDENFETISVLSSVLLSYIHQTLRCLNSFKEHVDEIKLQNTRKNH